MTSYSFKLEEVETALLTNGLAFLRRAATGAAEARGSEEEHQALAFAVVDIAVAVEVLLKARLAREGWEHVASHPEKTNQRDFLAGSSHTVTPDEAVERLKEVAQVDLQNMGSASGETFATRIKQVVAMRNQAAHFSLATKPVLAIRSQLVTSLDFALAFITQQWPSMEGEVAEVAALYKEDSEFVTQRMASLEAELAAASLILACPGCSQGALACEGWGLQCLFCHCETHLEGDVLADEYVGEVLGISSYEAFKDGDIWPVWECPDCEQTALVAGVDALRGAASPDYLCFSCGADYASHELENCGWCDRLIPFEHGYCSNCAEERMSRE